MTYKEACEEIDRLCEGWEAKYNNHKLESTAYKLGVKESTEKMQELACNIFSKTTNNALRVTMELSDTVGMYIFTVTLHLKNGRECQIFSRPWVGIPTRQITKDQFTHTLFRDIQRVLGRALTSDSIEDLSELSSITRDLMLARLAMEQNKFFAVIQAELTKRVEEYLKFDVVHRAYSTWESSVKAAMLNAATTWNTETSLTPGMKVAVIHSDTYDYSVKTLKALSEEGSVTWLEFTDETRALKNGACVYKLGTWFANNDRYKKIATVLGFPEVKSLQI